MIGQRKVDLGFQGWPTVGNVWKEASGERFVCRFLLCCLWADKGLFPSERKIYILPLCKKGGGWREIFIHLLLLNCLQFKIIFILKRHIWRFLSYILFSFTSNRVVWKKGILGAGNSVCKSPELVQYIPGTENGFMGLGQRDQEEMRPEGHLDVRSRASSRILFRFYSRCGFKHRSNMLSFKDWLCRYYPSQRACRSKGGSRIISWRQS